MSKKFWKLSDEEYEFIKGEVCHIFEKYKVKCIPVSGFEIATKMGITLIAYSSLSNKKLKKAMEVSEANFFAKYAIAPPILVHKIGAKSAWDIYEVFDISFESATYAYSYYLSWKSRYDQVKRLTDYEVRLLALFKKSA